MKVVCTCRLIALVALFGFINQLFAYSTGSPEFALGWVMTFTTIGLLFIFAIGAVVFIPSSMIEWHIFKHESIFKNYWQTYRINGFSLLLSGLYIFIFMLIIGAVRLFKPLENVFTSIYGAVDEFTFLTIGLLIMPAMIFIVMKLLLSNFIEKNITIKLKLILFNCTFIIIAGLIIAGLKIARLM